jgi:uncharacterized protein (TIGR02118 family)
MIKVSVMYPNTPGARFDHTYYRDKHMPLVKKKMGDSCKSYTVDKGLAGGAPGAPATYVGMCHIFCESVEAFQAGFGPHVPPRVRHALRRSMGRREPRINGQGRRRRGTDRRRGGREATAALGLGKA